MPVVFLFLSEGGRTFYGHLDSSGRALGHYLGQSGAEEDLVLCVSNEPSGWKRDYLECVTNGLSEA